MKVEIELPDWCEGKDIFLIAASECVAVRYAGEDEIYVKTERCSYHGAETCDPICCSIPSDCDFLDPNNQCGLEDRPLPCCVDSPKHYLNNFPQCKMRYEIRK